MRRKSGNRIFRKARRRSFFAARPARRRNSSSGGLIGGLAAAALYGASRAWVAAKIQPLTQKLPFGAYADEIGMLGLAWAVNKFVGNKVPIIGKAARAGMLIESAQIGQQLAAGVMLSTGGAASSGALF